MAAHVGTHIDAARHFYPEGPPSISYPYSRLSEPGVVLDVRRDGPLPITGEELRRATPEIRSGDIVLLYPGDAERVGQDAYRHDPYLAQDAAEFLVDRKVSTVGHGHEYTRYAGCPQERGVQSSDSSAAAEA